MDLGLHRIFLLPFERPVQIDFRAEAFNLFNHPQFGNPGTTIGTNTAGVIGAVAVPNRQLQFAARFSF